MMNIDKILAEPAISRAIQRVRAQESVRSLTPSVALMPHEQVPYTVTRTLQNMCKPRPAYSPFADECYKMGPQ